MSNNAPIGLFDSGVGGLTVVREVLDKLPNEQVFYFADTGRLPYGPLPQEDIQRYTVEICQFLQDQGAKLVVIACNTATAAGLEAAQKALDIPIIGVINPGAQMAVRTTKVGKIGVIATEATIKSGAYERAIRAIDPSMEVTVQACYQFTPLIEAGKMHSKEIEERAYEYLATFEGTGIDALVYGCTHYPLLQDLVQGIVGDQVQPVNPAVETIRLAEEWLRENDSLTDRTERPEHRFFCSGDVDGFAALGEVILGFPLPDVKHVPMER